MVEEALVKRFGPYAGWAHNTLFIAELSSHKVHYSPSQLPRASHVHGKLYLKYEHIVVNRNGIVTGQTS